jgi:hypothetical protein
MPPTELGPRLVRISKERIHFGRSEISRVDLKHLTSRLADALHIQLRFEPFSSKQAAHTMMLLALLVFLVAIGAF